MPLVKKRDAETNEDNVSPNENNSNNFTLQDKENLHGRSTMSREAQVKVVIFQLQFNKYIIESHCISS